MCLRARSERIGEASLFTNFCSREVPEETLKERRMTLTTLGAFVGAADLGLARHSLSRLPTLSIGIRSPALGGVQLVLRELKMSSKQRIVVEDATSTEIGPFLHEVEPFALGKTSSKRRVERKLHLLNGEVFELSEFNKEMIPQRSPWIIRLESGQRGEGALEQGKLNLERTPLRLLSLTLIR